MPLVPVGLYGRRAVRRISPWAGYSSALATLLSEAQSSGLVLDFTQNLAFRAGTSSTIAGVSGWSYTRSGTRFAGDTALTSFGANVPRIVAGSGIRVTAGATNLALQSQTLDDATWVKGNTSITANAIAAPDGTVTADKIAENTTAATAFTCRQAISVTTGTAYTASVYLRAAERSWASVQFDAGPGFAADRSAYFDLTNGALGTVAASTTATITNVGGGWYRCTVTSTATGSGGSQFTILTASANNTIIYTGVVGNGVHAWGAQLETGSTATDYIPTTSASATAGADAASVTFSQALPYSVIAEFLVPTITGGVRVVGINGGAETPISLAGNTQTQSFNGVGGATFNGAAMPGVITRAAAASAAGDFALTHAGGGFATSVNNTSAITSINLGSQGGTSNFLGGWLRFVAMVPRRAANAELQAWTV